MAPPPPGRFTTTIWVPSCRDIPSASTRAVTSAELPAGNSTMSSIGRAAGNACAAAGAMAATLANAAMSWTIRFRNEDMRCRFGASIRAAKRVVPPRVIAVALLRVAIDQRASIERVRNAPHLVLEDEQRLAARGIDDVAKAI